MQLEQGRGWIPEVQYPTEKRSFIDVNSGDYGQFFKNNIHFPNWTDKEIRLAGRFVASFIFGALMANRKFGFKYPLPKLIYDLGERDDYHTIAYHGEEDAFIFRLREFKKIVEEKPKNLRGGGVRRAMSREKWFELAGVEETAHSFLYKEKGDWGRSATPTGSEYDYFTSEAEERALLWKIAYTRRYMPGFKPSLSRALREARKLRDS